VIVELQEGLLFTSSAILGLRFAGHKVPSVRLSPMRPQPGFLAGTPSVVLFYLAAWPESPSILRYYPGMSSVPSAAAAPRQGRFHRFWRALRQMFLEAVGACFAFFGLVWLSAALRSYSRDSTRWLIAIAIVFALLFFFFAFSSFRRARKL
jgi:hypothetical protein